MIIVGIDPGKTGALTAINGATVFQYPMPRLASKEIDLAGLNRIIAGYAQLGAMFYMEKVSAMLGWGVSALFDFGKTAGLIEGMIVASGAPYEMVRPQAWQKVMFEGTSRIDKSEKTAKGNPKRDTKAMALVTANRLFPRVKNLATKASKKPHDGMIDSLLIAEYGRREQLGANA